MIILEEISLFIALGLLVAAIIVGLVGLIRRGKAVGTNKPVQVSRSPGRAFEIIVYTVLVFISLALIARGLETGHGPFSSMYEFAVAFSWGVMVAGIVFKKIYKTAAIQVIAIIVALLLLIFAVVEFARPAPLVPALQQSALLSAHVACAVVAYGTLTIGFGAAVMLLARGDNKSTWLPEVDVLDRISYHSVLVGFPFLTLLIILGALWADIAWGSYWSWDPKESASLVTWLIYAGYMHARSMRGWRGKRAAILLVAGFGAILLTFFGNYIFNGLHSYR